MKTRFPILLAFFAVLTAAAQPITSPQAKVLLEDPSPIASTNGTTDVPGFLTDVWNVAFGQGLTNLSTTVYGTYTPSLKKWGAGFTVMRNLPLGHGVATGIGVGLDYYADQFYAMDLQLGLSSTMRPFSSWGGFGTNILVTPFSFTGLGTPFGSRSTTSGDLETIAATGAAVHLAHVLGGDLQVLGIYGTRLGVGEASGVFYGGGINLTWLF